MCTEKHGVKVGLVDRGMAPLGGFVDEGLWEVDEGLWECFGWFCGGRVARAMVVFQDPILRLRCVQIAQHPCTCSLHQVLQVVRHGNADAGACPPCLPSLGVGLHVCRRSQVPRPRSVNLQIQNTCFALLCFRSRSVHCSYLIPTLVYLAQLSYSCIRSPSLLPMLMYHGFLAHPRSCPKAIVRGHVCGGLRSMVHNKYRPW